MNSTPSDKPVGMRWPEVAVAALLLAVATLVIVDSLRTGIGWADDGPRSGYFPFRIGLLLAGASAWVLVSALLRWRAEDEAFADRAQLASVMAMLVPVTVYVGGVWMLGIYVASALLIGYFMRRHGRYGWPITTAVSVGVPLIVFFVFERWFLVPLPKGPIERLLGF